jgi:peroxiredoxin
VAISVDSDAEREGLRAKLGLTFPLRKDDGLALARAYGVVEGTTPHPRPATFVLAADRTVLFAHVGRNAADRPALTDVLAALRP